MSTLRYRIMPHASAPSFDPVKLFGNLAVADICDALGRNAALPSAIKALSRPRVIGTAYTINLPASENLLFYYAVDNAKPGDVLVAACDGYTERAILGEILANLAVKRGLAGFVVDGAVRDVAAISKMDFPVYARAVTPNGPYKEACGEVNVPVALGNVVVRPGDIIVGDADGLVAISPAEAEDAAVKAEAIAAKGQRNLADIEKTGQLNFDWLYTKIRESGCEIH